MDVCIVQQRNLIFGVNLKCQYIQNFFTWICSLEHSELIFVGSKMWKVEHFVKNAVVFSCYQQIISWFHYPLLSGYNGLPIPNKNEMIGIFFVWRKSTLIHRFICVFYSKKANLKNPLSYYNLYFCPKELINISYIFNSKTKQI